MDKSLQVQRFEELPSSIEFESLTDPQNVPAGFTGKHWAALAKWNPSNGGLDYLQEWAGSCIVEAMLSRSAPVFYGDLRSHERFHYHFLPLLVTVSNKLKTRIMVVMCILNWKDTGQQGPMQNLEKMLLDKSI